MRDKWQINISGFQSVDDLNLPLTQLLDDAIELDRAPAFLEARDLEGSQEGQIAMLKPRILFGALWQAGHSYKSLANHRKRNHVIIYDLRHAFC